MRASATAAASLSCCSTTTWNRNPAASSHTLPLIWTRHDWASSAHPDRVRWHVVTGRAVHRTGKFQQHLNKLAAPLTIGFRDFYSGNFSAARSTLLDVGLFDEDFRDYGNEDGELARRLLAAGVPLRYSAATLARQHYEKDFDALARDNVGKGRTAVLLAQKIPGPTAACCSSGSPNDGTRSWRAIRAALLAFSAVFRFTPDLVIKAVHWLERRRSPHLPHYYRLALEYLYWMGARQAGRDLH